MIKTFYFLKSNYDKDVFILKIIKIIRIDRTVTSGSTDKHAPDDNRHVCLHYESSHTAR